MAHLPPVTLTTMPLQGGGWHRTRCSTGKCVHSELAMQSKQTKMHLRPATVRAMVEGRFTSRLVALV